MLQYIKIGGANVPKKLLEMSLREKLQHIFGSRLSVKIYLTKW